VRDTRCHRAHGARTTRLRYGNPNAQLESAARARPGRNRKPRRTVQRLPRSAKARSIPPWGDDTWPDSVDEAAQPVVPEAVPWAQLIGQPGHNSGCPYAGRLAGRTRCAHQKWTMNRTSQRSDAVPSGSPSPRTLPADRSDGTVPLPSGPLAVPSADAARGSALGRPVVGPAAVLIS
jgi:hypothetical protein